MTHKQLNELLKVLKRNKVQLFKNGKIEIYFKNNEKPDVVIQAIGDGISSEGDDDET